MIILLKDKKRVTITYAFFSKDESNCKPNKMWVDKGNGIYNRSMKSFSQNNYKEMHLMLNNGKSFIPERFIRTLKKRIYEYMTSVLKNVLDDTVNKYNNTFHSIIKMNPVTLVKKLMIKNLNFKLVILLEYQNVKVFSNWSQEVFMIKKVKKTVPSAYFISDLDRK